MQRVLTAFAAPIMNHMVSVRHEQFAGVLPQARTWGPGVRRRLRQLQVFTHPIWLLSAGHCGAEPSCLIQCCDSECSEMVRIESVTCPYCSVTQWVYDSSTQS